MECGASSHGLRSVVVDTGKTYSVKATGHLESYGSGNAGWVVLSEIGSNAQRSVEERTNLGKKCF